MKAGDIKIVGEVYTDNWDPAKAQTNMEQILTQNQNKVDAVLSENDGMAGGVIAALTAQGLAGKVPVSGQDGDKAALNRVALGTQTVDVWKDARLLGKTAGDAAVQLCKNADPSKVTGTAKFTTPGNNSLSSILLTPNPITQANLKDVLDATWVTKADLCQGVAAGKVAAALAQVHFQYFVDFGKVPTMRDAGAAAGAGAGSNLRQRLGRPIDDFGLSVRSLNSLKNSNIRTLKDLVSADDLSQVKRAFDLNGYVGIVYLLVLAAAVYVR